MADDDDHARDFVRGGNVPLYATVAAIVLVITGAVLVIFSNPEQSPSTIIVLGLIATSVPSLVGAIFSERASRDIRNGVVLNKVKEGARQALTEIHSHGAVPLHSHVPEDNDPVLRDFPHSHGKDGYDGRPTV